MTHVWRNAADIATLAMHYTAQTTTIHQLTTMLYISVLTHQGRLLASLCNQTVIRECTASNGAALYVLQNDADTMHIFIQLNLC